ncbi:hypothetical protein I4U23_008211 [Adineta vaga]|nr:hypothetical protein I4U23_008211 [Adineta vaga]
MSYFSFIQQWLASTPGIRVPLILSTYVEDVLKCSECQEESSKTEIMPDRGFRNDMKTLPIVCSLCEWNGLFKDYETHLNKVHPNPICEFCGEKFTSNIRLDEHKQKECPKITVSCPLKDYGCLDSIYRVQLSEHYLSDVHQNAIINVIRRLPFKSRNDQLERTSTMDVDMEPSGASSMITTTTVTTDTLNSQMQEIYETINVLASGIQTLNDDTQRISSDSTLLPYALSLNPGLPMHIQQTMIRQETDRRAQQQAQQTPSSPGARAALPGVTQNNETQLPLTAITSPPPPLNILNDNNEAQASTNINNDGTFR